MVAPLEILEGIKALTPSIVAYSVPLTFHPANISSASINDSTMPGSWRSSPEATY